MTFAELALTLLIIGVVFAVTVPGLKKTKERSQMETGLKKAYSTINQAVDRALGATDVDYARSNLETTIPDSMDQWDFTNNDKFMEFSKQFKYSEENNSSNVNLTFNEYAVEKLNTINF